ncbi:hypothetical protein [Dactylosporangium sp. NPDC049140]|uniref:hypothetical protein n=1 Tax=Dactylosporangium sp. NPDC049140 TaxID=3155647 RepID=UPI0033F4B6C9
MPSTVTVVHTPACHFCAEAEQVLTDLARQTPLRVDVHDAASPAGAALVAKHRLTFPLFLMALAWDRLRLHDKAWLRAQPIRLRLGRWSVRTNTANVAVGTVSRAYGTLGRGMHAGLPGHSFVLIDAQGMQRWYGEYPSMYLAPADLLTQVRRHLP